MSKGKGYPTISIPVQQVSTWAGHGENSESIAKKLRITVEDLDASLSSLAKKNRKSAQRIRQLLATNDKYSKPNKHGNTQSNPTVTSASSFGYTPAPIPTKQDDAAKIISLPRAETAKEAALTTKKTMSTEVETLKLEIEKTEKTLDTINQVQANAEAEIEASKKSALEHEQILAELAQKLRAEKVAYEAEMSKLNEAEQALITCEGRRAEQVKHLAELKARLHVLAKPEIYVCDGEIQTENVTIPEIIDVSDWARLIDSLPDNIGNNLRKKDAELLIRLRAIMKTVDRDDAELAFDNDMLQKAYEALVASES